MLSRFIRIRKYHNNIIYYFENPRNIGSFKKGEPNVFTGLVGAPACGDVMKIELKIEDDIVIYVVARFVLHRLQMQGYGYSYLRSMILTEHKNAPNKKKNERKRYGKPPKKRSSHE